MSFKQADLHIFVSLTDKAPLSSITSPNEVAKQYFSGHVKHRLLTNVILCISSLMLKLVLICEGSSVTVSSFNLPLHFLHIPEWRRNDM